MRLALLLGLFLAGCPPLVDPAELEPSITVGTGDRAFEPLADGDTILIIEGPQGGFHLLGSVRFTGVEGGDPDNRFDPSNPTCWFRVHDGGDRVDYSSDFTQGLDVSRDGEAFEELGRFIFLDIVEDDELVGRTLEISAGIDDVNGVSLRASVSVVAQASPFNG